MQLSGISVVIPAYNEERYLPTTLEAVIAARSQVDFPVEVIVVDNASTDRTVPFDAFQKMDQFMSSEEYIGGGLGLRLLSDRLVTRITWASFNF